MPHIDIKTTQTLTAKEKIVLTQKLSTAFANCSDPHVAGNIQYTIEDEVFISFRGDHAAPSANIQIHPGPLTPVEDYEKIVKAFFQVLTETLAAPKDHIYITISKIQHWGFDGEYITVKK